MIGTIDSVPRCLSLSALFLCCALLLGGCIVVPFPSTAEPAPLPEADSIIAGLTTRAEILERLGEPLLVSLDGRRSVHAGIHRSGGGMLAGFGAGYSGGESRFVEIVFVSRKLGPGFRRPYELEIHELDAETGRRAMAARRLIISQ